MSIPKAGPYSTEIVIPAVKNALRKRGFKFPKRGGGISKDAVMARRMTYSALINFTSSTDSGIATIIGCSPSTVFAFQHEPFYGFQSSDDLDAWLIEVYGSIKNESDRW